MEIIPTPLHRGTAMKVLGQLTNPTVQESKLNRLGQQELTLLPAGGGTPLTITLKFDGTWVASTPFMVGT